MEYNFNEVEKKWQKYWSTHKTYRALNKSGKPKYYVLDMFPYPSGAGLHVGHPLGYIASDIYSRYKRLKGFNVLHPMGYDAYGLPAEQYAIQTGQHPAITTEKNIARYREQLDKLGLSFDWEREVRTCDPGYYKWTQWVFIKLFKSWYNKKTDKAEPIENLIKEFEAHGNTKVNAACSELEEFSAVDWKAMNEKQQQVILMNYRLAYLADTMVNWCPALGTVLANDEVSEGISVRGGHPVERKSMKQWLLRITAYSDRLLKGLDEIEWSDSIKEVQRNWIGKSEGALMNFKIKGHKELLPIFTTRPDTIFGVTYMAIAPEHELVMKITTADKREEVKKYIIESKNRSDRERMADIKRITGEFSGAFAIHPFTGKEIPVWIADYVLLGYGTGAVMAVPGHDSRDYAFAKHFNIPIVEVISGGDISQEAYEAKEGIAVNSDFINGMQVKDAIKTVIAHVEKNKIGERQINYRLRDAIFSRQRYWGEPFPIYYKDGVPYTLDENELPLVLPEVDKYLPTETGEPPLARAKNWQTKNGEPLETNTMPGFAGSSAYYLRYMDPENKNELVSKEANNYWQNVDLYIGGSEHATGHLIYSRFWNKFLFDLGLVCKDEPYKKLINQGMIQGRSNYAYRVKETNKFISHNLKSNYDYISVHVDVNIVKNDILDIEAFKKVSPDLKNAEFILEDGKYICGWEVEKMSKTFYNVINPDELVEKYGADTLRLYEMFLGPLEQHKPWDTNGIEGVFRFIKKLWRLYHDKENKFFVSDEQPTKAELKVLHRTIKKVKEDIERFSFNTSVSNFMICVNELSDLKCNKRVILQDLAILLSPYAPHIAEEFWNLLGNKESITYAKFPDFNEEYLVENNFEYPVSVNGKLRFKIELPLSLTNEEIEKEVLAKDEAKKWLEGKQPKKIIIVQGKIVNIVV
ncbi:MAG: leucine--tRNA ligase [Bacteroidales bacterium]|nr:leucine--tRNA ligase [Bacteroidales bacterium]